MSEADKSFLTVDSEISFRANAMEGERSGNLAEGSAKAQENRDQEAGFVPRTLPLGS